MVSLLEYQSRLKLQCTFYFSNWCLTQQGTLRMEKLRSKLSSNAPFSPIISLSLPVVVKSLLFNKIASLSMDIRIEVGENLFEMLNTHLLILFLCHRICIYFNCIL